MVIALLAVLALAVSCGGRSALDARPFGNGDGGLGPDVAVCLPKSCAAVGATCGSAVDGCGGTLQCGSCPEGQTCGGGGTNKCGTNACVPTTCMQANAGCGVVSDGCSKVLDCGGCAAPLTCSGGGMPNRCGCTPATCSSLGANCGS
ncbi:MAG: hypothetical protein M3O36_14270, partial [Myxococcota bacterium]|nr:hypothetical protein [Myxococcota bacterium]